MYRVNFKACFPIFLGRKNALSRNNFSLIHISFAILNLNNPKSICPNFDNAPYSRKINRIFCTENIMVFPFQKKKKTVFIAKGHVIIIKVA